MRTNSSYDKKHLILVQLDDATLGAVTIQDGKLLLKAFPIPHLSMTKRFTTSAIKSMLCIIARKRFYSFQSDRSSKAAFF